MGSRKSFKKRASKDPLLSFALGNYLFDVSEVRFFKMSEVRENSRLVGPSISISTRKGPKREIGTDINRNYINSSKFSV